MCDLLYVNSLTGMCSNINLPASQDAQKVNVIYDKGKLRCSFMQRFHCHARKGLFCMVCGILEPALDFVYLKDIRNTFVQHLSLFRSGTAV